MPMPFDSRNESSECVGCCVSQYLPGTTSPLPSPMRRIRLCATAGFTEQ